MRDEQWEGVEAGNPAPLYPPAPETYLAGAEAATSGAASAGDGASPWPGQPAVYPPPPERYVEAAKAAPTFVTPSYSSPYEASQARPAPARLRRRWLRIRLRAAGQPITEWDIALTFLSAAVSFVVYAVILTWPIGLGLTLLILLHEMGHFVVIRAKGMPARLPIFIPLVGAFVLMGQGPMDARDEAEIALAGPVAGMLGSVACLVAYWFLHT
ncbi:MAG TPA: site-2 protease family protein, partial [Ktedonobacterales bacterium]